MEGGEQHCLDYAFDEVEEKINSHPVLLYNPAHFKALRLNRLVKNQINFSTYFVQYQHDMP